VLCGLIFIVADGETVSRGQVTTQSTEEQTVSPRLVQLQQKLRDAQTPQKASSSSVTPSTASTTQAPSTTQAQSSSQSDSNSDDSDDSNSDNFLGPGYSPDDLKRKMDAIKMEGDRNMRQLGRDNKIAELESQLREEGRRRKSSFERVQSEEIDSLEDRVKQMESVTQKLNDAAKEQVDLLKQLRDKKDSKKESKNESKNENVNGKRAENNEPRRPKHRRPAIDIVFKKLVNDLHLNPSTSVSKQANNVNPYAVLSAAALSKSGFGNPDIDNLVAGAGDLVGLGEDSERVGVTQADGTHPSLVVPTVVDRAYLHAFPRAEPVYEEGPVLSPLDRSRLAGTDALIASQAAGGTIPNDPLSNFPVAAEYTT